MDAGLTTMQKTLYPIGLIYRLATNPDVLHCIAQVQSINGYHLYRTWSTSGRPERLDNLRANTGGTLLLDTRNVPKIDGNKGSAYFRLVEFISSIDISPILWLGGSVFLPGTGIYGGMAPEWVDVSLLTPQQLSLLSVPSLKSAKKRVQSSTVYEVSGF